MAHALLAQAIFLPSMACTTDRKAVEEEGHRLMIWHALLPNLVDRARATDQHCTWHLLADAAAQRLEADLEELREWLDALDASPGTDSVAPAPS